MPGPVTFNVEIDSNGDAIIRLPEGAGQQRNAGILASFTEKVANLIGKIRERHVGSWKDGVHVHKDGEVHSRNHEHHSD